jgi:hypothetical protein
MADPDHEFVRRFLTRGIDIADRALAERKFQNELCRGAFPANEAVALRTKAQCLSILTGVTPDDQKPRLSETVGPFEIACVR